MMSSQVADGAAGSLLARTLARRLSSKSDRDKLDPKAAEREAALAQAERIAKEKREKEWASWVNTEFTKCKNARAPFERQWYVNLAFVNGRHYLSPLSVPGQGFRLSTPKAPPWRVRLVVNKARIAIRTETAKLCSNKPIPTVIPATAEDEDWAAANVSEQLLKTEFATAEFSKIYRRWVWWASVTGTGFIKSYWDPNCPDPMSTPKANRAKGLGGQELTDPKTEQPIYEPDKTLKGKIKFERITPFHIYVPDLLAEDLEDQPYVMHVMTKAPLWVKRNFGFTPNPDTKASTTIMDAAMISAKSSEQHLDSVLVKEVWLKPNAHKDFPNGGLLTIIGDRVVQSTETWPLPFYEFPFYKLDSMSTGCFYADSILVDLIPLNKEYNRTRSQMIEIKNTVGKPKLLYQRGSLNPRQISSEPGQAIPYLPGFEKPTELRAMEIPASMVQELATLNQDFDDISGQHEISRGDTPPQVTSGTAIAFLQEQDDTKLSYPVASVEQAIELLGRHYLRYVTKYWDEPRLIRIVGKDSDFEARQWRGSDLKGNTDVKVQTGSALPVSKAAKQAMITEFMQNGWIAPESGLEVLELGGLDKVLNEFLADKKQAQRENLKMSKLSVGKVREHQQQPDGLVPSVGPNGQQIAIDPRTQEPWQPTPLISVNSWDNHEAHIQYHNMYRKTQEFELLPPEIKQEFELHVQTHQMAMVSPQMGQAGLVANQPVEDPNAQQQDPAQLELEYDNQQAQAQRDQQGFENNERRSEEQHQLGMIQKQVQMKLAEQRERLKASREDAKQSPKQIN